MRFSFYIATRYFFTRSKQNVINIINYIAIIVVMVATAALLIVLSAFSGLKDFGLSFTNVFDPDFRVESFQGKTFLVDSTTFGAIKNIDDVLAVSGIVEDKVFLNYRNKNHVAYLKGVDDAFNSVIDSDQILSSGKWFDKNLDEVVIGTGISQILSLGIYDYNNFLVLTVPKRSTNTFQYKDPFLNSTALVSGIYQVSEELDKKYLFSSLNFARELFRRENNEYTSLELKLMPNFDRKKLENELEEILKEPLLMRSRAELNAAFYKMLNTEQIAVYLIFTLVIIIALFNVIGALVMMILEKKKQFRILYALGVAPKQVRQIFFLLGGMISWVGGGIGIVLATIIIIIQSYAPFFYVPGTHFPYPVHLEIQNIVMVLGTLIVLGSFASAWTTFRLDKKVVI